MARETASEGNLAGVLGDMLAGLLQASLAESRWQKKGKDRENKEKQRQEGIKELGEKVGREG